MVDFVHHAPCLVDEIGHQKSYGCIPFSYDLCSIVAEFFAKSKRDTRKQAIPNAHFLQYIQGILRWPWYGTWNVQRESAQSRSGRESSYQMISMIILDNYSVLPHTKHTREPTYGRPSERLQMGTLQL